MAESMTGLKRTHRCAELSEANIGEKVTIMGWVQKNRNKGGLVFVDVRDRSGLIQVVFEEGSTDKALLEKAAKLRSEFVVAIVGTVEKRSGAVNENLATGAIEIKPEELRILSESETPPFPIEENSKTKEEVRLKYRFLDLRRPDIQRNLMMRSRVATLARQFMAKEGFLEIETPFLIKSTPEGARDYLVPSRIHPGSFYALPQSPQIFKQLLMCSGYDRYFQIVKCFRDEDLRADRQPEFTQMDMELSFVDVDDVIDINERLLAHLFKDVLDIDVQLPIQRMTWQEAMDRFGSDKPDIRFGMELVNVTETVKDSEFVVFKNAIEAGGTVRGINAKGQGGMARKKIDKLTEAIRSYGAKGMVWMKVAGEEVSSSVNKFFSQEQLQEIAAKMGAADGDLILIVSDKNKVVFDALGFLRRHIAGELGLLKDDDYKLLWVVAFPLFEYDEETDSYQAMHHPFTSPKEEDAEVLKTTPIAAKANAYDIVLNGVELGGGSIRIHDQEMQEDMFRALDMDQATIDEKFGFLVEAFKYGTPPHGGLAYGLDRLVMLLTGEKSIREDIAFPKNQNAQCMVSEAPGLVDEQQLDELGLKLK